MPSIVHKVIADPQAGKTARNHKDKNRQANHHLHKRKASSSLISMGESVAGKLSLIQGINHI